MKFKKKHVVIEAEQFIIGEINNIPNGVIVQQDAFGGLYGEIETLEGIMRTMPGDWIITGVRGEKYSCKKEIFEETYELVTSESERLYNGC
jgi:hypothetical protein